MLISGAIFIFCAMGKLPMLPVSETLIISAGLFFIGLGERTNHYEENLNYPVGRDTNGYILRNEKLLKRNNKFAGVVFDIIGFAITSYGVYKISLDFWPVIADYLHR